jgi:CheY-like chemotaxis protein
VKIVDGRIHALARAHNQITDDHWGPAPLNALIDAEASAFTDGEERVVATGKPVLLNPQAYSTMALVFHELVTNSAKYGALSVASGKVYIDWKKDAADDLEISWRDTGGPKVSPPTRKGFGTTIIERSVPYDLGGSASIEYLESGTVAAFRIPHRHVSDAQSLFKGPKIARSAIGHPQPPPEAILDKHQVLLVEDSLIIALDAEDILQKLGATNVLTAASVSAATDQLATAAPSVAMLDVNLGTESSFEVADLLDQMRVPFFFATGYGEQAQLPDRHRGRPVIQKPYTIESVARAMHEVLMMTS